MVLNNRGDENNISRKTQQKILEYAKKHNYVPNQLARSLRTGKSETIGLIMPNISNLFYAEIASYIEEKAEEQGYTVIFSSSHENPKIEQKLIRSMVNRQVDGLIIASTQGNLEDIRLLKNNNFPLVLIDRHYPEYSTNFIVVNNYEGIKNATKHLINLGRRKIAFISVRLELDAMRQRLLGYEDAMNECFGNIENKLIKILDHKGYRKEMRPILEELLKLDQGLDAIVFATHYLTASGIGELKNIGVKVPKEVAIVSFDEMSAFDIVDPPITYIMQPSEEIGTLAVEVLLDVINGKNNKEDQKVVLGTKLVVRKSCGT